MRTSRGVTWSRPEHERAVERVRRAFKMRGEYQSEFARRIGWTEQKVSRILRGETQMDLPDLLRMCRELHLSADWVLGLMPDESFAALKAQPFVNLTALPYIEADAVADDLAVAASSVACHLPADLISELIACHAGDDAPERWPYGRFVVCRLSPDMMPPGGGAAVVDRYPDLDVIHGLTVLARGEDGRMIYGKLYRIGEVLTISPAAGPPQQLPGPGAVAAAVVAVVRPVAAVG